MITRRGLWPLLTLGLAAGRLPDPPQTDETLHALWEEPPGELHPYFATSHAAFVIARHVWDTLLVRDPETLRLRPALARTWRQTDRAIEFTLRPDVTFQDGTLLTAEDVVRTVRLATTDPRVANPDNYAFIAGAEATDAHTVVLRLTHDFPPALDFIASVLPILPASGPLARPAGTGPYALADVTPTMVRLSRFANHVPDGPKSGAQLDAISLTVMSGAAARLAAVAAGDADWTWDFGVALFDDAVRNSALTALRQETARVVYLAFDAAGRSGPTPWTDARVRRAVALGLDRPGIAHDAAPLGARALDVPCFPTQFGCDVAAVPETTPNPALARQALADAGFPDGFETTLVTALPERLVRPVVDGLRALGIEARAETLPPGVARDRLRGGAAPLWLGITDGFGVNDVSAIFPAMLGGGPSDQTGDETVRSLIRQSGYGDPDQRRGGYTEALRRVGQEALVLPLYAFVRMYAFTKMLQFRAPIDDVPRFYEAAWR